MINDSNCSECNHKHDCKSIYEAMGHSRGPSVLGKVFAAFVIPIFVFILTIAAAETILIRAGMPTEWRLLSGFILAVGAALLAARIGGAIIRKRAGGSRPCVDKETSDEYRQ